MGRGRDASATVREQIPPHSINTFGGGRGAALLVPPEQQSMNHYHTLQEVPSVEEEGRRSLPPLTPLPEYNLHPIRVG